MNYINDALMLLIGFFLGFGICYRLSKKYFRKKGEKSVTIDIEVNSDHAIKAIDDLIERLKAFEKIAKPLGFDEYMKRNGLDSSNAR